MKTISPTAILDYYDGVLAFEGRDDIGGHYIGAAVKPAGGYDRYLVTGARPERLRQFRSGTLDLRTLLLEAPGGEWYITLAKSDSGNMLELEPQAGSVADAGELLPLAGYTLDDSPIDDLALEQALDRNNVVFEFAAQPPESAAAHRIRMNTLGGLLLQVQQVVKYAHQGAVRELSDTAKRSIVITDGYLMDVVVPATPGSYRVIMEAANPPDLFGYGELARGLQRLDEVFDIANHPDAALEMIQNHRGRLAGSFIKLMSFLAVNRTGLAYSWAYPGAKSASHGGVSEANARLLTAALSGSSHLGTEQVTLVGEFERVNRSRGDWGLLTPDGVKSGVIAENGPSLNGLQVGKSYRFECQEDTELDAAGREKHTLYLNSFEDA